MLVGKQTVIISRISQRRAGEKDPLAARSESYTRLLEILRQFNAKGLEFAFPTQTIFHQSMDKSEAEAG